jgi:hypothetical protein
MTEQGTRVVVYGSLRDILRAIDEEDELWPDEERELEWTADRLSSSTALVARYDQLPAEAPGDLGKHNKFEQDDTPTENNRSAVAAFCWSPRLTMVMAAGVGALCAGLPFLELPAVNWSSLAHQVGPKNVTVQAELSKPFAVKPAALAETRLSWQEVSQSNLEKVQRLAALAEAAKPVLVSMMVGDVREGPVVPDMPAIYALTTKQVIDTAPGETVDLPFEVSGIDQLPSGARIVLTGVPEHAALSAGEPQADGTWVVPAEQAGEVKLTTYALPGQEQRKLTAELRAADDALLARTTTLLKPSNLADAEDERARATTAASAGMHGNVAEGPMGFTSKQAIAARPAKPASAETTASKKTAAPESLADTTAAAFSENTVPDWTQEWTRSSLGGPR